MQIIPAIDLLKGQCVRLYKGDYEQVKVYNEDPLDQALEFQQMGVKRLHLVDLDGAKLGSPFNKRWISDICSNTDMLIEVGGGIRDIETVESYLKLGVSKIIMSSALAKNPKIALDICKKFGNDVLVAGIDFKNNRFAVGGWLETTDQDPLDFALELKEYGVTEFMFTDVSKDGTLEGPNVEFYKKAVKNLKEGVLASGGVGADSDLEELAKIEGLKAVIVGKAFYENKVDIKPWL